MPALAHSSRKKPRSNGALCATMMALPSNAISDGSASANDGAADTDRSSMPCMAETSAGMGHPGFTSVSTVSPSMATQPSVPRSSLKARAPISTTLSRAATSPVVSKSSATNATRPTVDMRASTSSGVSGGALRCPPRPPGRPPACLPAGDGPLRDQFLSLPGP